MAIEKRFQVYSRNQVGEVSGFEPGLGYRVLGPWADLARAAWFCRDMMRLDGAIDWVRRFGSLLIADTQTRAPVVSYRWSGGRLEVTRYS